MNTSLDVLIQAASYVDRPAPLKSTQPPQPAHSSERESDFSCGSTVGSPHSATLTEDNLASGGQNAEVVPKSDAFRKDKKTRRRSAAALSRQASSSAASASSDSCRTSGGNKRGGIRKNPENRSVHNVLEKNRRAHLKDCFEALKTEVLENDDDKKASHLAVLRSAVRCLQQLQRESGQLQRDTEKAHRDRSVVQLRLQELKHEMRLHNPTVDASGVAECDSHEEVDSQATCTAPPGSPPAHHTNHHRLPPLLPPSQSSQPHQPLVAAYSPDHAPTTSQSPTSLIKSVADILEAVGPSFRPSPQQSLPSSSRDKLPLRKRILQDEQGGLFSDTNAEEKNEEVTTARCSINEPNMVMSMPQFWPAGTSFFPTMQMYSNGTTAQPTFGLVPMMNQFYLPVTNTPYGISTNSAVTSPIIGHLPQVFMLPTAASAYAPQAPPSSSATSSMLSGTSSLRYTST
ncbi:hypothetical protein RvY_13481 [Ramazzottius varieornatus]|uniref:BHLH domain-containing protein n=1 Tax=Ramazzottius varieornatus TaxID=947166 RepID=A0A1D1VTA2_RAMVA|nr:hypothetical protein RvY_13481 [Ramazzottius varieornatus]